QWQGLTGAEIEETWPGAIATWRADPTWAPPDGESRVDVAARAMDVVTELDEEGEEVAVLAAHGGLISGLVGRLLELPVPTWNVVAGLGNCHWTLLTRRPGSPRWRLAAHNVGVPETEPELVEPSGEPVA